MSLEHHSWNETTDSEDETASFSLTTNGIGHGIFFGLHQLVKLREFQ